MTFRPLTKELQKVAENELNEVPDRIQDDLNNIKEWLLENEHLHVRTDDQWLISYLRSCKFNLQRTKNKLEYYHLKKIEIPEFFHNRDPFLPEIQEILSRKIIVVLPKTVNAASPKIIFFRAAFADPEKVPVETFLKVLLMIMEILYMEDDNAVVAGVCNVTDLNRLPYKYLTQLTPNCLRKAIMCVLSAFPTRLKGGYFFNSPSFFQIVFKIIRIFLPHKLKNRIKFFSDFDDLYQIIPMSILPKEYGGEEKSCDEIAAEWKLKVESYKDWFLENDLSTEIEGYKQKVDLENSFEKLDID